MLLRSVWTALIAVGAAIDVGTQSVVVNPTKVEFTSTDHEATLPSGEPAVSGYVLQIWLAGVDSTTGQPMQQHDLGKPPAVAGTTDLIVVDRGQTLLSLPVAQEYFVTVKALGPAGEGRSAPSNGFVRLNGPTPPQVRVGQSANEIVLYASDFPPENVHGRWQFVNTADAAMGVRLENPNLNEPKIDTPLAPPANYVEVSFTAASGVPYRLWLRSRAEADNWANDSLHVQFSGSVNASGQPVFRIGSASSAVVVLEEGAAGRPVQGWGWNDHSYGALAEPVYFESSGPQVLRIQQREDGISFDQIVLSAWRYYPGSPGAFKNDTVVVPKPQ